jgi:hypothetical protein
MSHQFTSISYSKILFLNILYGARGKLKTAENASAKAVLGLYMFPVKWGNMKNDGRVSSLAQKSRYRSTFSVMIMSG